MGLKFVMTGISEIKTSNPSTLPAKVYISSLRILQVRSKDTILYKNEKPNSGFQLPLSNIICDESDNFALRTIYLKLVWDLNLLRNNIMKVDKYEYEFKV